MTFPKLTKSRDNESSIPLGKEPCPLLLPYIEPNLIKLSGIHDEPQLYLSQIKKKSLNFV